VIRRLLASALVVTALAGAACTKAATDKDKLLGFLNRTEKLARTFSYEEIAAGHRVDVQGTVRDDFRYSEDATLDGRLAAQQVVYDDARAMRITDLANLQEFLVPSAPAASSSSASATSAAIAALPPALKAGDWVVDPTGESGIDSSGAVPTPGANPLTDALVVLEYARLALNQAQGVSLYNPQSETYRPSLDPFPRPPSGTIRYDLVPPDLPPRQNAGGAAANLGIQNQVPGVPFFRLMAFYVKDGLVRQVRESISLDRRLRDSQSNLQARIGDYAKIPPGASLHEQSLLLLRAINHQLGITNQPLVRPRDMSYTLSDLGRPHPVQLPDQAVPMNLAGIGPGVNLLLYETS
jgi:hypothetical protein